MKKEKELREMYKKIIELIKPVNKNGFGHSNDKSMYKVFCYIKLITAREKLKAGYLLTQNSLSREVLVFIRAMVEELAELKYIKEDKNLVDSWAKYDDYIRLKDNRKQLKSARQNNKPLDKINILQKKLEQKCLSYKDEFAFKDSKGKRRTYNTWYCMSFEQLCQKVGMEDYYDIMYPYLSMAVHSSSRLANQYIRNDGYYLADNIVEKEFKELYWYSMIALFIEIAVFYFEEGIKYKEVVKELKSYSHELKDLMGGDFIMN